MIFSSNSYNVTCNAYDRRGRGPAGRKAGRRRTDGTRLSRRKEQRTPTGGNGRGRGARAATDADGKNNGHAGRNKGRGNKRRRGCITAREKPVTGE